MADDQAQTLAELPETNALGERPEIYERDLRPPSVCWQFPAPIAVAQAWLSPVPGHALGPAPNGR
jgi:hypothetical protein